ncbi:MAG TPA: ABC transporter permease [Gemmatimonadaceae bacterium]|jgi:putative ABC transport system permease protein|nr:ABC transporter permease [Gemmatimonadaceae bacterium]
MLLTALPLLFALQAQVRTIAIGADLAADAGIRVGDTVVVSARPGGGTEAAGAGAEGLAGRAVDTVVVSAIVERRADPSEIARNDYRVRLHLDQLQHLIGYGDRVDRFAVGTVDSAATERALGAINDAAFGFQAYRSRDIAAETSTTFEVVSRFHRAIGVITIVASAVFLLCILLLKVEERRRDVGALRLIGLSRWTVFRSVVIEAAFVSVLGSGLGVAVGWITSAAVNAYYQAFYRTPLRFSIVTGDIVLFSVLLSLALGVVAGALAALRLVRTAPLTLIGR